MAQETVREVTKEEPPQPPTFSYDPPEHEFAQNKLRALWLDNKRLKAKLAQAIEYVKHKAEVQADMACKFDALMAEKEAEIAELKTEIATLKEKIVRLV